MGLFKKIMAAQDAAVAQAKAHEKMMEEQKKAELEKKRQEAEQKRLEEERLAKEKLASQKRWIEFPIVGLPYHDAPEIMEAEPSEHYTKHDLKESGIYCEEMREKEYTADGLLKIEHGEHEGAVQVHTKDGFIGYIAKRDTAEFKKLIKNILGCRVTIYDGNHYILYDDDDYERFEGKMSAKVEVLYLGLLPSEME